MKKLVMLGLLSVSLASAKIFVGIDGGYSVNGIASSGKVDTTAYSSAWNNIIDLWSVGANLGYEGGERLGYRAFISFDYSRFIKNSQTNFYDIGLNADLLLNFINTSSFSTGLFLGVGAAYEYVAVSNASKHNIPLYGRAGLTFGLGEHVRLDLTAKLPIITWNIDSNNIYSPMTFQAGLKYKF